MKDPLNEATRTEFRLWEKSKKKKRQKNKILMDDPG